MVNYCRRKTEKNTSRNGGKLCGMMQDGEEWR